MSFALFAAHLTTTWNTHNWLRALWGLSSLLCAEMVPQVCHCNMWLITLTLCSSHDKYRNKFTLFTNNPLLSKEKNPKWSNHTKGKRWNRKIMGQKLMRERRSNFRMQNISAQLIFMSQNTYGLHAFSIQIFICHIYCLSHFFSAICFVCVFLSVRTDQAILKPDLALGVAFEVFLCLLHRPYVFPFDSKWFRQNSRFSHLHQRTYRPNMLWVRCIFSLCC